MNVKELIEELKKMPQEWPVYVDETYGESPPEKAQRVVKETGYPYASEPFVYIRTI